MKLQQIVDRLRDRSATVTFVNDKGVEAVHTQHALHLDALAVAARLARHGIVAGCRVGIAAPSGYQITDTPAELFEDPVEAVKGADAVYTDVWVSMSDDESSAAARREALQHYAITDELLDHANDGAFALHCLPAHPGEEITESVLYGDRQRIWDQAENRRHAQKALLEWLLATTA